MHRDIVGATGVECRWRPFGARDLKTKPMNRFHIFSERDSPTINCGAIEFVGCSENRFNGSKQKHF